MILLSGGASGAAAFVAMNSMSNANNSGSPILAQFFIGAYVIYMLISIVIAFYDLFFKYIHPDHDSFSHRIGDSGALIIMIFVNVFIFTIIGCIKLGQYLIN